MYEYNDAQAKYLDEKEAYLDKFIDESDDEALFLSSYIHGHFSVTAAKLSQINFDDITTFAAHFKKVLCEDIELAIQKNELSTNDATAVKNMLSDMFADE